MRAARLLLVFIIASGTLHAQERMDSLRSALDAGVQDTERIDVLVEIAREWEAGSADSLLKYAQQAYELADSLDYFYGQHNALHLMGFAYSERGLYDLAERFFQQAIELRSKPGLERDLAITNNSIGITFHQRGEYPKAQEYYLIARELWEQAGDQESAMLTYGNIGRIYEDMGNMDEAYDHYEEFYELAVAHGIPRSVANASNLLGSYYQAKGNYEQARVYFERALQIHDSLGLLSGMGHGYNNLAITEFFQQEYAASKENFRKALMIRKEIGDPVNIAESYRNLGDFFAYREIYDSAVDYYKRSIQVAQKYRARNPLFEGYGLLAEVYDSLRNYELAYKYYRLYKLEGDTLVNEEANRAVLDLEVKYESEKILREKEDADKLAAATEARMQAEHKQHEAEQKEQSAVLIGVIIGLSLIAIVAIILYVGYQRKQKVNAYLKLQRRELVLKNEEIESKNKDITDSISYAQRLQQAILPGKDAVTDALGTSFILYLPRDIVSGDFYWVNQVGDERICVAADCTGHGVPGAFLSVMGGNALNKIVVEEGHLEPKDILKRLNEEVHKAFRNETRDVQTNDGMDVSVVKWNPVKQTIAVGGAMNPVIVVPGDEDMKTLMGDRCPIGGRTPVDHTFTQISVELKSGDWVYQFSDGFQDQFGGLRGKKYMAGKFRKLLATIAHLDGPEQLKRLKTELDDWTNNQFEQVDDILVMGYRQP